MVIKGTGGTEIGNLLPHIKSQGAIDLEYESDGKHIECSFWSSDQFIFMLVGF